MQQIGVAVELIFREFDFIISDAVFSQQVIFVFRYLINSSKILSSFVFSEVKNRKSKWLFFFIAGSFDMKDVINFKEHKSLNDLWNIKLFCPNKKLIYNPTRKLHFMLQ